MTMAAVSLPPAPPPPVAPAATPDDLLGMEQRGLFELVDGELVEKPTMGLGAGKVASRLFRRIGDHAETHGLGEAVCEISFQCFAHRPAQVRRPDIAFIKAARLVGVPDEGHVPIAPDLVVEVISPTDNVYELDEKLADYRTAGVPLVWVVNPAGRIVRVFRPGRPIDELSAADTLGGEDVLPGFAAVVGDLLPPAA